MQPSTPVERGNDPCLQIQVDLSAMVDGELDPVGVRRVMTHSDMCASCRSFLDGVRSQVRIHQRVAAAMVPEAELQEDNQALASLRKQLTANRRKLSKVLYELGRGFVLMGLGSDFSREVTKEPAPVTDTATRGRNLLDEAVRAGAAAGASEWTVAKELFDGQLRTPDENLAKGQRLLSECLAVEPDSHPARIYLGLVHYVRGQRALARKQFQQVLVQAKDRQMRGFALLNLGNIHLDEGDGDGAVRLLLELVESGAISEQPSLGTAYFNLGLAFGLSGRFRDCVQWFQRMAAELPHKRSWMARELGRRSHFVHLIRNHPEARVVADAFPSWFAARPAG